MDRVLINKENQMKKGRDKFKKVMKEYKKGELHSGSKKGPKVKKKSQALAIAYSEDRKANKTGKGMKNAKGMKKGTNIKKKGY